MDGEYVIVENDVFYETMKQKEQREREERMAAFDHVAHGFESYDDALATYRQECKYVPYQVIKPFEEWAVIQKAFWEQKKREEFEEDVRQRGLEMVKWEQERKSVRGMKAYKTGHGVMRLVKKIARVFVR